MVRSPSVLVGSKWLLAFPRVPVATGTSLIQTIFPPCCPLNDRRREACSLFEIDCLFSLLSCLSLSRLFILLLLVMSGNVHSNPGTVFSCSVCTENETERGRSVQCFTCSNCVHLKCLLLSFSRFKTLGSSQSWSCVPVSSGNPIPGAINYYILSRIILLISFLSRNLSLIYFPLFQSLDSLLCDLIALTPGLAFSLPILRTLAAASSISSDRAYPSLNFLIPFSLFA